MTDDDIPAPQQHFTVPFESEKKIVIIGVININD